MLIYCLSGIGGRVKLHKFVNSTFGLLYFVCEEHPPPHHQLFGFLFVTGRNIAL